MIKHKTYVVHCKKAPFDVYIGREYEGIPASKWGNPFVIGKDGTRDEVISKYEEWIKGQPALMDALPELRGKTLGCWCAPTNRCHGDVLAKLVDELPFEESAPVEKEDEVNVVSGQKKRGSGISIPGGSRQYEIMPVFYDHSSNKSLLTYWKDKDCVEGGPQSIAHLCKEAGLKTCFGVSDNLLTFPEAQKSLSKEGVDFIFGLELWLCDDATQKNPESVLTEHKIIIRADNSQGYHDLIRLYTEIYTNRDYFYYKFRFDFKRLKPLWTENLTLILPFFDSFVCKNALTVASIVPDLPANPIIFREVDSGLPFHDIIDEALDRFNKNGFYKEEKVKTVFYTTKKDAKAWMVYRCISNHSSFQKPQMEFCCSDNFSFQDWVDLSWRAKP